MNRVGKVVVIAPYWQQLQHVGVTRVSRFNSWLVEQQVAVVLVQAGAQDRVESAAWGKQVTIRDPLRQYGDVVGRCSIPPAQRRPNRLRRWLSSLLVIPDLSVLWARRASRHSLVLDAARGANWVVASSPPESVHVGAYLLAKRLHSKLAVDLRDGWLDEPLRLSLQERRFQRWREGRMEKQILSQAARVFVTSDTWRMLLERRLPWVHSKTTVLTNGYPNDAFRPDQPGKRQSCSAHLSLLYAGQFSGSRHTQQPEYLLSPFMKGLAMTSLKGEIHIQGRMGTEDLRQIHQWEAPLGAVGWSLQVRSAVGRDAILRQLPLADGLLLLSTSLAPIPCKLFEYLQSGRPILAVTPSRSAVWNLVSSLPQVFVLDPADLQGPSAVGRFLQACAAFEWPSPCPEDFTNRALSRIFLDAIGVTNTKDPVS